MLTCAVSDHSILAAGDSLPSAPRLLVKLGQLMRNPQVEASEVITLLRQDPALVAQIVRMANTAAYAPHEPIGSLERAIGFIGFAEVHRLVGVIASNQLADLNFSLYGIDGDRLRLNTLFVAILMEEMARWAEELPFNCYTVGLLRPIGMMALQLLAEGSEIPSFKESGEKKLDEWERKHWGTTNPEVAEKILSHWRMPHETVTAIRHHYRPLGRHNPKIHLLALAAGSAADTYYAIPGEEAYWKPCEENFVMAGFDSAQFGVVIQKAHRAFQRLRLALG